MPLLTQQQFLDELKKVEFKTFPTHLGLVQLLRSLLMRFTILTRIFTEKKE